MSPLLLAPLLLASPPLPAACAGGPCIVPDTRDVLLSARDASIAVFTNFGIVLSGDGATGWRIVCEEAYGSTLSSHDRMAPDGRLFVASYDGLFQSATGGCCWTTAGGVIAGSPAWDVAFDASGSAVAGGRVWVTASDAKTDVSTLAFSDDGGRTFAAKSAFPPETRLGGLALAPSDPRIIYLSGYLPKPTRFVIEVSEDGGATWSEVRSFGDAFSDARLLGVSPGDPRAVLLARRGASGKPDEIHRSTDEGRAPSLVLSLAGSEDVRGFTFAGDANTVYVAGKEAGMTGSDNPRGTLYASHDGGRTWDAPLAGGPGYRCLGFREGVLHACAGDEIAEDPFALGASDDGGKTWRAVMRFRDLLGAPGCLRDACRATTDSLCALQGWACGGAGGAGGNPGCGGAGGSGGSTDGGGDAPRGADAGGNDTGAGGGGGDGCGCRLAASVRRRTLPAEACAGLGVMLAIGLPALRRRKHRRRRTEAGGGEAVRP